MGEFDRLGDLLGAVAPERRSEPARLAENWPSVVGAEIARNAVPTSLRAGKLIVAASSPAWAQTLQLMSPQVIERLNAVLGEDAVREMVVRSAGWPGDPGADAPAAGGVAGATRAVGASGLSEDDEAAVAEVERAACDPVLGARLAALMRATLLRAKSARSG
ncbi:MAG: DUF721 domain-containing protein [Gaiellales bacterium]|nr:DUF721 domain-containing protein [Gaiellales bacterium]